MARKKSASAANQLEGNAAEPKRGEKTQAIRDLYAKGVTKPSDVDAALKGKGLSVSKPVIYQTLNKLKEGSEQRGRPRSTVAAANAPATVSPKRQAYPSSGLVVEDINQLALITEKAGGVDVVVGLLQNMKRVQ